MLAFSSSSLNAGGLAAAAAPVLKLKCKFAAPLMRPFKELGNLIAGQQS
jgi:hypothetical protein